MFITPAYAQTSPGGADFLNFLFPMAAVFALMYFLVIRPQQRRLREHRDMVMALRRGDIVVTSGGIIGKVTKVVGDNELQVEIADGVRVKVVRGTIGEVRSKTEPVKETKAEREEEVDEKSGKAQESRDKAAGGSSGPGIARLRAVKSGADEPQAPAAKAEGGADGSGKDGSKI